MQLKPHQPLRRSINLATQPFLIALGMAVGGQVTCQRQAGTCEGQRQMEPERLDDLIVFKRDRLQSIR